MIFYRPWNASRRGDITGAGIIIIVVVIAALLICVSSCTIIAPGTVGVQVTMGSVENSPLLEGAHMINPISSVHIYHTVQQTFKEEHVQIPSQDQLMTTIDVSVQYRVIGSMAPQILRETGTEAQAIIVHLEPKLRSALREVGKGLARAEDFFMDATQVKLQNELEKELSEYCKPKGIEVQGVLLRDMQLPPVVAQSVVAKKEQEQKAVQQQAMLARYTVEQQQTVAKAEADKQAATFEAEKVKIAA